jgi:hypothetical protein
LLILGELLTFIQWVEVRGEFCWYWWNCLPSLNELRWEVIFFYIGGIVDHHSNNSQYQQKSPLTLTHWVMVNNSTNINKNHLSHQRIEWCQQFHQYQQKSPLTSTHWEMVILVELLTITQWVKVRGDFYWYWWNCWPSLNELRW